MKEAGTLLSLWRWHLVVYFRRIEGRLVFTGDGEKILASKDGRSPPPFSRQRDTKLSVHIFNEKTMQLLLIAHECVKQFVCAQVHSAICLVHEGWSPRRKTAYLELEVVQMLLRFEIQP